MQLEEAAYSNTDKLLEEASYSNTNIQYITVNAQ